MKLKLLILIPIVIFIGDIDIDNNSTTYTTLIDYRGFYRVTEEDTNEPVKYEDSTLNINVGDKIIWVNDDMDERYNIISEQQLWRNDEALLTYSDRRFSYIFNEPGIYAFYINKYPFPTQTVIVSDIVNISDNLNESKNTNLNESKNTTKNSVVNISDNLNESKNTTTKNDIDNINLSEKNSKSKSDNPITTPLNIMKNLKIMGVISFVVAMVFLMKKR